MIAGYSKFPGRNVLKMVNNVLMYMFKRIHEKGIFESFTIFDMKRFPLELRNKLRKVKKGTKGRITVKQTDVKEMFTNLEKESIVQKVIKMIDMFLELHEKERRGDKKRWVICGNKEAIPNTREEDGRRRFCKHIDGGYSEGSVVRSGQLF